MEKCKALQSQATLTVIPEFVVPSGLTLAGPHFP
jgi:hypothetical protein